MGMVIRVAFNNQGWSDRCKDVLSDHRLFKCKQKIIDVNVQVDEHGHCTASCWDRKLCSEYCWENNRGRNFNTNRARGKVFFVYPDIDNSLVLWGKSEVERVEGNKIYFRPFKPMPHEKWVKGLSAQKIVGKKMGRGFYRYISAEQESLLESLYGGSSSI